MKNIVVLISGRGTNLEALLRTARTEQWSATLGAAIVAVISNRPDVTGLDVARQYEVPAIVVAHRKYSTREDFDRALAAAIDSYEPSVIVLAGFMRVLGPLLVRRYEGRLINIHPSLLPAFPGLRTHEEALAVGVRIHGATVHFVSEQVDGGAIIAQAAVPVRPEDDAATLAARVLEQEHRLLPRALRLVLEQRVSFEGGRARVRGVAPEDLALLSP
ncbi:MAG TPA: phosphoribosylglycinamide formyltransferase [Burkholderiaceae bacterium]|nr:phosphoribosylglycinamide formyltransferase [Burkholderiaceae bacterium]